MTILIEKLKNNSITSKEELADLASDELMPILEISEDQAGEIIMAAGQIGLIKNL